VQCAGLKKLTHDIQSCEYEDIRVMWEMLNRNESLSEFGSNSPNKIKKMHYLKLFKCPRCAAPYISHSYQSSSCSCVSSCV
jgi:hypothetical protein